MATDQSSTTTPDAVASTASWKIASNALWASEARRAVSLIVLDGQLGALDPPRRPRGFILALLGEPARPLEKPAPPEGRVGFLTGAPVGSTVVEDLDLGAVDVGPAQVISSKEFLCDLADVSVVNSVEGPPRVVEPDPLAVDLDVELDCGAVAVGAPLDAPVGLSGQGAGVAAVSFVREGHWVVEVMLLRIVDDDEVVAPASSELPQGGAGARVDDVPPSVERALGDVPWCPRAPGAASCGLCYGDGRAVGLGAVDEAQERAHSPPVRDVAARIAGVVPDGREHSVCREVKSVLHDRTCRYRVFGRRPHPGPAEQERLVPGCGGKPLPPQGGSLHVSGQSLQPLLEEEAAFIIRELTHVGGRRLAGTVEGLIAREVPVAAICGATYFLARNGFLDERRHTSNAAEFLAASSYQGAGGYVDAPVITDQGITTASGVYAVPFTAEVMRVTQLAPEPVITTWEQLYLTGDPRHYEALMEATGAWQNS